MTSGLARLVLNKQALCGLKVLFWLEQSGQDLEGIIEAYDQDQDSFVLCDYSSGSQYAVRFHEFTVEEEQQQLVLRVTSGTQMPVPKRHRTVRFSNDSATDPVEGAGRLPGAEQRASDSSASSGPTRGPSTQLSAELSQQLSSLIGQSFSHTEEGFAPVVAPATAEQMDEGDQRSSDGHLEDESYWGSPVKHAVTVTDAAGPGQQNAADSAAAEQAASDAGADYLQMLTGSQQPPVSVQGEPFSSQTASMTSSRGSPSTSFHSSPAVRRSNLAPHNDESPAQAVHPSTYTSFQEISRMISDSETAAGATPIPIMRRNSNKHHPIAGFAAHLLDETASWGTPGDGSPWGTPREHHMTDMGAEDATQEPAAADTADDQPDSPIQQPQQQEPAAADDTGPSWLPNEDSMQEEVLGMSSTGAAAPAAEAGTDAGVASDADGTTTADMDFTIPTGVDVQPRPSSRNARRSNSLFRLSIPEATDSGMVDIPQPLTSRRASRASHRNMYLSSDPGTTPSGSGLPIGELRRATSNAGNITSRRISRTTSGRVNADQDWNLVIPEATMPQQHLPPIPLSPGLVLSSGGVPVHVPGPASRRISRTLSGRPPLDQDGAVSTARLPPDDGAPDVVTRALTATAAGIEVVPPATSRRQSSADGRPGTPDSDGFGYSEFEGVEPLVPPEVSQWDAIAEEAVFQAVEAATPSAHQSHRHQRRSVRNMGAPAAAAAALPPTAPTPRAAAMRISDQDDALPMSPLPISPVPLSPLGPISPLGAGAISIWMQHNDNANTLAPVLEQLVGLPEQGEQQPGAAASTAAAAQEVAQASGRASASGNSTEAAAEPAAAGLSGGSSRRQSASASGRSTRGPSRKASFSGILQKAVSAAEAAAAAVGKAFTSSKGAAEAGEQQRSQQATEEAAAATTIPAEQQQPATGPASEQPAADEDNTPAKAGNIKSRLLGDSLTSADSFSCPPFMPMIGGSESGPKYNPFAEQLQQSNNPAAFQIGTAVADSTDPTQQVFGSLGPNDSLVNKQLLPAAGSLAAGSEWGSGNLAARVSSVTSGIDTPTGSGIFKTNPFAEGSDSGSPSRQGSDGFPSVPATGRTIGASRMGREAAAAAAGTTPFGALGGSSLSRRSGANTSEITPASDDEGFVRTGNYYEDAAALQQRLGFDPSPQQELARNEQFTAADAAHPAAAGDPTGKRSAGSSSDGSTLPPPSYTTSTGAEADDERSPYAADALLPGRQAWPAAFAAGRDSISDDGSGRAAVRHDAQLDDAAQGDAGVSGQQPDSAGAALLGGSTGLTRRPSSRTPSQKLSNNVAVSMDGMVMLPAPTYDYADDASQPLVQHQAGVRAYSPSKVHRPPVQAEAQIRRVIVHSFLSTGARWFDLIALVILGGQLMSAMASPQLSQHKKLSTLFVIFAAGHVLSPVGCLLWPKVTGKASRRAVLAWTVGLSMFPTALLGCMPAYSEGANAGLTIIAILRIISGIAHSNEAPAALVYLAEHSQEQPCLHSSLVPCAMAAGALGAAVTALFFALVLPAAKLATLGWRLTLAASLVVNGVNAGVRGFVLQDPEQHMNSAEVADRRNDNVWRVIRYHLPQLCAAVVLQAFAVSGLYLLTAWMPVYYMHYTELSTHTALLIHAVNTAMLAGCVPLGGFLADQYGRTSVLLSTCAAAACFAYPAWLLFSLSVAVVSWFSQFTLVAFVGLHWGALTGTLVDMFPQGMRTSALSIACMLPTMLLGSITPLAALGLIQQTGSPSSPAIVMIVTAVLTGGVTLYQKLTENSQGFPGGGPVYSY